MSAVCNLNVLPSLWFFLRERLGLHCLGHDLFLWERERFLLSIFQDIRYQCLEPSAGIRLCAMNLEHSS